MLTHTFYSCCRDVADRLALSFNIAFAERLAFPFYEILNYNMLSVSQFYDKHFQCNSIEMIRKAIYIKSFAMEFHGKDSKGNFSVNHLQYCTIEMIGNTILC